MRITQLWWQATKFLKTDKLCDEVWRSYGSTIREKGIGSIPLFVFSGPGGSGGPFREACGPSPIVVNGSGSPSEFQAMLGQLLSREQCRSALAQVGLAEGVKVVLRGLVGKPELNSQEGLCGRFDLETGRVKVKLSETGKYVAIKLENLQSEDAFKLDARRMRAENEAKEAQLEAANEIQMEVQGKLEQQQEWERHMQKAQQAKTEQDRAKQFLEERELSKARQRAEARQLVERLSLDLPWVEVPENLHLHSADQIHTFFDSDGEIAPQCEHG